MLCTYKKETLLVAKSLIVVHPGLEPRLADPESDVLPLHQWTNLVLSSKKRLSFSLESGCKSTTFFSIDKYFFSIFFLSLGNQQNIFHSKLNFSSQNTMLSLLKKQKKHITRHTYSPRPLKVVEW